MEWLYHGGTLCYVIANFILTLGVMFQYRINEFLKRHEDTTKRHKGLRASPTALVYFAWICKN
jgi:hypothetical protein